MYNHDTGLWDAISIRIDEFMHNVLDIPISQIPSLRHAYFNKHGTTLSGLQEYYDVDPEFYLSYVHDIPLRNYLSPDIELRDYLNGILRSKWIFTNADRDHAERVLRTLGIYECFQGIIDIKAMNFISKPDKSAYHNALTIAGESDPGKCILIDDLPRNLIPAYQLGFITILFGTEESHPAAYHSILNLLEIKLKINLDV
jgi:putative hydrolase of the HAD superfamily